VQTSSGQRLKYVVDLTSTETHKVHVTLEPEKLVSETVTFQMPVWAPGAYSVSHYGKYVQSLAAFGKAGAILTVKQVNDDRWEIEHAKSLVRIEYDVFDSHKDSTSLYFAMANMDTSFLFANATAFFGYVNDRKDVPAIVIYQKPENWQLTTALDPASFPGIAQQVGDFHHTVFSAKNYDMLADAPVMAAPQLQTKSFREGSADYDVVVASNKPFPMDSLSDYTQKIVRAETQFFHDTPFSHYTFIIYAPTLSKLPSFAEGALEHANSSDYLLMNLPWTAFKGFGLPILSHEFFHLWNVKRIHSSLLGPFDYTQRVKTTSLWLAEGITEYYAHTLLSRSGITSSGRFYDDVKNWVNAFSNADSSGRAQTLEQLSIAESDFSLDNAELFYIKGPLVGMMLDIDIRSRTDNKKSLDDVMLALNKDAKLGKTFKDDELIHKVEKIAGIDLSDFYKRYIAGTDSLPVDTYLAKLGLRPVSKDSTAGDKMNIAYGSDGHLQIQSLPKNSPLAEAGLEAGDQIIAINGSPFTIETIDKLTDLQDASSAKIDIMREGKAMSLAVDMQAARARAHAVERHAYEVDPNATSQQNAMRKGMVEQL
jgi:predicted metalloprotease with PDZ domain